MDDLLFEFSEKEKAVIDKLLEDFVPVPDDCVLLPIVVDNII